MNKTFTLLPDFDLNRFIKDALKEDTQPPSKSIFSAGDHTSLSTIPKNAQNKARLIIKQSGILAGVELAKKIFHEVDKHLQIRIFIHDGTKVKKGDIAFIVSGNARSILTAERVVLNCMQRMSGIATTTNKLVMLSHPTSTKLLDTRKTTPLFRAIEKWAVKIGGGYNHRFGLYDMILIKNNHIDFAGGIQPSIQQANSYIKKHKLKIKIEIEARNIQEVKEILKTGNVARILLDNFSPSQIKNALELINHKVETEISGGINEKNIKKYASLGADYISIGALTHSSKSMDMSLTAV